MSVNTQPEVKASQKKKSVAQRQHWLYGYAAFTLLLTIIGGFKALHTSFPITKSLYISSADERFVLYQGMAFGIVLQVTFAIYLITAKNIRHILFLFKLLLIFGVLSLVSSIFFRPPLYMIVVSIVQLGLIAAMVKLLQDVERSEKKQDDASDNMSQAVVPDSIPKGSKTKGRIVKIVQVIFRIVATYYGLILIWTASLLLRLEHDRLTVIRLYIPLTLLGIFYISPYYVLKDKLRVAYISALILVTTLAVLSLQIPVHPGKFAPDSLPIPQGAGSLTYFIWSMFRASPIFIFYSALIVFDTTAKWSKKTAQESEDKRAAIVLLWATLFICLMILGSIVRPHTAAPIDTNSVIQPQTQSDTSDTTSPSTSPVEIPDPTPDTSDTTDQPTDEDVPTPPAAGPNDTVTMSNTPPDPGTIHLQ